MRARGAVTIAFLLATTTCRRDETDASVKPTNEGDASSGGGTGSEKTGPVASAKQHDGTIATWKGGCATIVLALQAELAKLPSSCATDAECVCYAGGVGGVTECGGVSDVATAKRIDALTERFGSTNARCAYSVQCAAYACKTACVSGTCRASPP